MKGLIVTLCLSLCSWGIFTILYLMGCLGVPMYLVLCCAGGFVSGAFGEDIM